MLVISRLASSGPSLSKLHSLRISWIVRSWLWFFFPLFAANRPYSSHPSSKSLLWCQRRKEWTELQARREYWNNSHHRQPWRKMAGQNSQGVMWVHVFLRLQSVFFWANLNVKILPKLVISIKLEVCYRVDKTRKILNDKHRSIFTSFV